MESHSSFCSPFSLAEFHAAASNLSPSTAIGPEKVAYPMQKHLPRSGMDFLLYIFNLSWSSHSFPSIWKTSSIIPIHNMGKPHKKNGKAFDSVWHPALFHKLISARLPPCFLAGLNLFFLIGALLWSIKITEVAPFEPIEVFRKDPLLALYFSLSSLMIFRLLCLFLSASLFTLTI